VTHCEAGIPKTFVTMLLCVIIFWNAVSRGVSAEFRSVFTAKAQWRKDLREACTNSAIVIPSDLPGPFYKNTLTHLLHLILKLLSIYASFTDCFLWIRLKVERCLLFARC